MKKKIIYMLLLILGGSMMAQNKKVISQSGEKVLMRPVMTTAERDALVSPYIGYLIFNTTTGCHEFYNGIKGWYNYCWDGYINTSSSGGTAVVSSYDCSGAAAGSVTRGVAVTGVSQTITATATQAGTYDISATANGVTFSGSGNLVPGANTIVLTASGTPIAAGVNSFALSTTPGCSFNRTTL